MPYELCHILIKRVISLHKEGLVDFQMNTNVLQQRDTPQILEIIRAYIHIGGAATARHCQWQESAGRRLGVRKQSHFLGPIWISGCILDSTKLQRNMLCLEQQFLNGIIMLIAASWTISDQSMCAYEQNQKQSSHKHLQLAQQCNLSRSLDLCVMYVATWRE